MVGWTWPPVHVRLNINICIYTFLCEAAVHSEHPADVREDEDRDRTIPENESFTWYAYGKIYWQRVYKTKYIYSPCVKTRIT